MTPLNAQGAPGPRFLVLEVGKYYMSERGQIAGPMEMGRDGDFCGPFGCNWRPDGSPWLRGGPTDREYGRLISEVGPPASVEATPQAPASVFRPLAIAFSESGQATEPKADPEGTSPAPDVFAKIEAALENIGFLETGSDHKISENLQIAFAHLDIIKAQVKPLMGALEGARDLVRDAFDEGVGFGIEEAAHLSPMMTGGPNNDPTPIDHMWSRSDAAKTLAALESITLTQPDGGA